MDTFQLVGNDMITLTFPTVGKRQFFPMTCENVVQPDVLTLFRTSVVTLLAYHYVLNIWYLPQTQPGSYANFLKSFV